MGEPATGVCAPWATIADVCSPCDDYDFDVGLLEDCLLAASEVLFKLTARRYPGVCTQTVHPLRSGFPGMEPRSYDAASRAGSSPYPFRGGWPLFTAQRRETRVVGLGVTPVIDVTSVTVAGAVLDPGAYRVDDYRWLVRTDGSTWPSCPDPIDDPEGFHVDVTYGRTPPQSGILAAASLGCELALSCSPETVGECRLPSRVTSITRQGISMVVLDPFDFLEDGKTGVYEVDLFIKAENPERVQRRARAYHPSRMKRTRRVDT